MIKITDKKFVYYNKHNIKKSIKILKSHLKDILSQDEINFIYIKFVSLIFQHYFYLFHFLFPRF
jgi:hypothetical protein